MKRSKEEVYFTPDQLSKKAFSVYSNSDYNFYIDDGTYYVYIGRESETNLVTTCDSISDINDFLENCADLEANVPDNEQ